MSKLNINRNIFLEREELLRWQQFMLESPVNKTFLANTINWGIIDTSGGVSPVDFLVEQGTNSGTVKISNLSRALTSDGLIIEQQSFDNLSIPNDASYYWIKISHIYSNIESGVCSVNTNGEVAGTNTLFTEVLRGQSTEVPVKIKFVDSLNNTGTYEVVDVIDDNNIILLGDSFTAESNLQYYVIGSTPFGETITSQQELGLYFYDSCQIDLVEETVTDTEPAGKVQDEEFWIARVVNNSGTVTVQDKRTEYWEYYIRGVSDKLNKDPNEWSFTESDQQIARNKLVVYSTDEVDALLNVDTTSWTPMNIGTAANSSGFDLRASRIGKTITVSGRFKAKADQPTGAIIASLSSITIAEGLSLTRKIYGSYNEIGSGSTNRGMRFYIDVFNQSTLPSMNLIVDSEHDADTVNEDYIYVNLTFNVI